MPIEQILEIEAIKSNPGFVQELKDAFDRASALEKVKQANADLTGQRSTWESEKKDLTTKLAEATKTGGATPELRALQEQLAAVQAEMKSAKDAEAKAVGEKRVTDLKNSVVGAATSAISPNQVYALMQTDGLVGHGEDGKAFYHRINERGEPVAAKPDEAVAAFLKSNPHLERASGTQGSGQQPKTHGSAGKTFNPMDHL